MSGRMWRRGPDGEIIRVAPAAPQPAPDPESIPGADTQPVRTRAHLGLALRLGFRDTYDYLGSLTLMSFLFALIASAGMVGGHALGRMLFGKLPGLLPLLLTAVTALTGLVLVGGPLAGGLYRYARNAASREEPDLFHLAWGFRSALGRSLALAAAQVYGGAILLANCYFYLSQRSLALVILGAMVGYLLLFWSAMGLYQWPLLAEQKIPISRIIKKSALLALDNLGFTLLLLLVVAVLTVALWVSVVGAVLLWAGTVAMVTTQATRELLRKYEVLGPDPTLDPIAGETHELGGHGWHE